MTQDEIIDKAIPLAQQKGQSRDWQIGDICCHPKEEMKCAVLALLPDNLIEIGWGETKWIVPRNEIFDLEDLKTIALNLKFGFPPFNEGEIVTL